MFVLGDGDCGQFGKGEDVTEALRPTPSPLPEGAGQARCAALPAGCSSRGCLCRGCLSCAACARAFPPAARAPVVLSTPEAPAGAARPWCPRGVTLLMRCGAAGRRWCSWPRAACTARRSRPAARCSRPASTTRARSAAGRVRRRGVAAPPCRSGAPRVPCPCRNAASATGGRSHVPGRAGCLSGEARRPACSHGMLQPRAQPLAGPPLADEAPKRPASCSRFSMQAITERIGTLTRTVLASRSIERQSIPLPSTRTRHRLHLAGLTLSAAA